jgi:nucleotide-binding universal stress UspA family protein
MSYRKILLPVFGSENDQAAIKVALNLARLFGAHVEALFVRLDPVRTIPYGYIGSDVSGFSAQYAIEAAIKAADEAQALAQATFDQVVKSMSIEVNNKPGVRADATAEFRIVQGDFADEVERAARMSDLIVFSSTGGQTRLEGIHEGFEAALLSGSRPVLFVPREPAETLGQRVAIAYDGSAAAAHAVSAALPFLMRAKSVHSFEITPEKGKSLVLEELRNYLSLRGVTTVEHVVAAGSKSTAEALSQAVESQHCELLVLGGYGHSRVREFVLGGVTRHLLRHGSNLAILMAH